MTTTTKATTATRKTATRKTATTKAVESEAIVFTNVKQISDYYNVTSKNVRRLLRSNKDLLLLNEHQKNAIYAFDDKQSEAIKTFFDERYKSTEAK